MSSADLLSDPVGERLLGDFLLLVEAGMLAIDQQDEASARCLFETAALLQPDNQAPKLGLGFIALSKLDLQVAQATFKEVLEKDPTHSLAQALLGLTLCFDPRSRSIGCELVQEAASRSDDAYVHHLREVIMQWVEHDLEKKTKAEPPKVAQPAHPSKLAPSSGKSESLQATLKDPSALRQLKDLIAQRLLFLKRTLQKGIEPELFKKISFLLKGYTHFEKVVHKKKS